MGYGLLPVTLILAHKPRSDVKYVSLGFSNSTIDFLTVKAIYYAVQRINFR